MAKLPVVSGPELVKALEKLGFQVLRQKGSHIVLQKRDPNETLTTVVPNHKELAKGTLRSILRQTKIPVEQLIKLLVIVLGVHPLIK